MSNTILGYGIASGTGSYTVTIPNIPTSSVYRDGGIYIIKIQNENTVADPSININTAGQKFMTIAGIYPAVGAIKAGIYILTYNETTQVFECHNSFNSSFLADYILDYIESGFTVTSSPSNTNISVSLGIGYVNGNRFERTTSQVFVLSANRDIYIDIADNGTVIETSVSNNAAEPALGANRIRIAKLVTDGTGVTTNTDLANRFPFDGADIKTATITQDKLVNNTITSSKLSNIVTEATKEFATVTVDSAGRVTGLTSMVDITGVDANYVLAYNQGLGQFVPVNPSVLNGGASEFSGQKEPVLYATIANISDFANKTTVENALDKLSTVNPVLVDGDRVLVKNQTTQTQNGIYIWNTAGGNLIRATDADGVGDLKGGISVTVSAGDLFEDKYFYISTPNGDIAIGTDNIVFSQFTAGGTSLTGTQVDNRITRGNGTDTIQSSAWEILDGTTGALRPTAANTVIGSESIPVGTFWGKDAFFAGDIYSKKAFIDFNAASSTTVDFAISNSIAFSEVILSAARNGLVQVHTLKVGTFTLPNTDGSSGQVLMTNGLGVVTWQTVSGGGGGGGGTDLTNTQTDNRVTRGNGTDTVQNSAWEILDGTTGTLQPTLAGTNLGGSGSNNKINNIYANTIYLQKAFIEFNNPSAPTVVDFAIYNSPGIGTLFSMDRNGLARFYGTLMVGSYTLPTADGTSGQVIVTNGSGVLSFADLPSSGIGGSIADTQIAYGNGTSITGSNNFVYENNELTIIRDDNTFNPLYAQKIRRTTQTSINTTGSSFVAKAMPEANSYTDLAYGKVNGVDIWVAISNDGTNRIMRSINNGNTWTAIAAPQNNLWNAITFGNGLFVAVSSDGTNRVMTSPDGTTWTVRTHAFTGAFIDIDFDNGLFVAITTGVNLMTSEDGINWVERNNVVPTDGILSAITSGLGLKVIVASTGTNRVFTSPDGITWIARTAAELNAWEDITCTGDYFVAVASSGTNRVMTSDDGITWTAIAAAESNSWNRIEYGNGLLLSVASSGTNRVMTSVDKGATWQIKSAAESNSWNALKFGNSTFIALSTSGTNRAMVSDFSNNLSIGYEFELETSNNNNEILGTIQTKVKGFLPTMESGEMIFNLMKNGAAEENPALKVSNNGLVLKQINNNDKLVLKEIENSSLIFNKEEQRFEFWNDFTKKWVSINTSQDINLTSGYLDLVGHDSNANTILRPLKITRTTTVTPSIGIGIGMDFDIQTGVSNIENAARLEIVATDVTNNSEDFAWVFKGMAAGATPTEFVRFTTDGIIVPVSKGLIRTSQLSQSFIFDSAGTPYICGLSGTGQVRLSGDLCISNNYGAPVATSILDIQSTTKGVLLPRLTGAQETAISSPADYLQLNNTTQKSNRINIGGKWVTQAMSFYSQVATKLISNTTTETTIVDTTSATDTNSLPANWFVKGRTLRLTWFATISTSTSAVDLTVNIKHAGTTITTQTLNLSANLSNQLFTGLILITCTDTGSEGNFQLSGEIKVSHPTNNYDDVKSINIDSEQDTNAAGTLDVSVQWSAAAAGNSLQVTNILMEIVK